MNFFLGILIFLMLSLDVVGAVVVESPTEILPNTGIEPGVTIASIIAFAISITAILSVISITWGAIQMIYAAGEDEKIKKGRMIIIYSFVGLLLTGAAYGIVRMITNLQFNI